jgi:hypothetical protein
MRRARAIGALLLGLILAAALSRAANAPTAARPAPNSASATSAALPASHPATGRNTCANCHRQQEEARLSDPVRLWTNDIHYQRGVTCADCHGGNPNDSDITAMDPDRGYIGKPTHQQIPDLCVKCHGNAEFMKRFRPEPYVFSMAEFRSSVHGRKLLEGDQKVATCISCHGAHGILSHKDPASPVYDTNVPRTCAKCHNAEYMKGYGIPTDQFANYKTSVHGRALLEKGDLSAPACNDCHGNHGAAPPNTRDISIVCGNCHGREGELFAASGVSAQLQIQRKRGCVTCHSNHAVQHPSDAMIGLTGEGLCGLQCHAPGSACANASVVIVDRFHALKARIQQGDSLLSFAAQLGMPTEKGREFLKNAQDQLVNTRVTLHTFDDKQITGAIGEGDQQVQKALDYGRRALKDWGTRRAGMGMSVVAILIMILLLVLKIRQADRESPPGEARPHA